VGDLDFHYITVVRALLVEQGRRGRAEAVAAVVAARGSIAVDGRQRLVQCFQTLGRPRHWTPSRLRIGVARSRVFDTWFRVHVTKTRPKPRDIALGRVPLGLRVGAGFDSGRGDFGDRHGKGRACCRGGLLFYFYQLTPRVILLVFLLVSVAIDG
jgi:hypothetical protein